MAHEIIKQPNGRYAVVSVHNEFADIIKHNLTKEECVNYIFGEAKDLEWFAKRKKGL